MFSATCTCHGTSSVPGPVSDSASANAGLPVSKAISDGSSLAVLTAPECDTRQVSYEMTLLVERVGRALTPDMRGAFRSEDGRQ